ncbi:MAG: hypothetical protein ABIL49_06975 [candidate division WOR-3 bacterium]|jgi:hypothetical protein
MSMIFIILTQIFSDNIKSNNGEYDKLINQIYKLRSFRIDEDSLEKIKMESIVKGYKFKVYKFENVVETFKSATMDGRTTIEQSDPKDVEIYEFYKDGKILFYVVKETYLGLNKRVYVNLYFLKD